MPKVFIIPHYHYESEFANFLSEMGYYLCSTNQNGCDDAVKSYRYGN